MTDRPTPDLDALLAEAAQAEVLRRAAVGAADDAFWAFYAACRDAGRDDCHALYYAAIRERQSHVRAARQEAGNGE